MTKRRFIALFFLTIPACVLLLGGFARKKPNAPVGQADRRPNIIIIMADDLGFSDLGCYGGEIATPNLDKLARNGARLTSFYNTARCCPTRASLLTGLYPHQAGIGRMTLNEGQPGYRGTLTPNTVTIAEVLRSAGYQTGMVGKWHLSETSERPTKAEHLNWLAHRAEPGDFADPNSYPTARGFDRFYGTIWGVVDYFDPFSLVSGTKPVKDVPANFYYTNALGDSAVSFVDGFAKSTNPFFLYVAHTAPHWPVQALPEDIKKYENTYQDGWERLRQRRYGRLVAQKLIDPATTPLPAFMFPRADWGRDSTRAWDARAMAVHAAMVDRLDQTVGKLVAKLAQTGQLNNTLILFLSDNGASSENPSAYGPGFDRAGSTRDGRTVAFPTKKEVMPGGQLVHAGIGDIWAHAINTPFRYYKAKLHEGGITTPLIAHWPAGIRPGPGAGRVGGKPRILDEPTHVIDLMATCLDLAQTGYPTTYGGRKITPTPGRSLVPMLRAGTVPAKRLHPTLFWEHFGAAAFREGDWKIVRLTQNDSWELYDLKRDRSETTNLANMHPERVAALAQRWEAAAREYQVYPKPGKN